MQKRKTAATKERERKPFLTCCRTNRRGTADAAAELDLDFTATISLLSAGGAAAAASAAARAPVNLRGAGRGGRGASSPFEEGEAADEDSIAPLKVFFFPLFPFDECFFFLCFFF